jgi:hypothetical protein
MTAKDLDGHEITIKIKLNNPDEPPEITKRKCSTSSKGSKILPHITQVKLLVLFDLTSDGDDI